MNGKIVIAALALFFITACEGGVVGWLQDRNGGSEKTYTAGQWDVEYRPDDDTQTNNSLSGIISESGENWFNRKTNAGVGPVFSLSNITGKDGVVEADIVFIGLNSNAQLRFETGTFSGNVEVINSYRTEMTGQFTVQAAGVSTPRTGTLEFRKDTDYDPKANSGWARGSELKRLFGMWASIDPVLVVVIEQSGTFTAQAPNGCVYSGQFKTVNTEWNAYDLNLTLSSCGLASGDYTSVAKTSVSGNTKGIDDLMEFVAIAEDTMQARRDPIRFSFRKL